MGQSQALDFFGWPRIKDIENLARQIQDQGAENFLGLFLDSSTMELGELEKIKDFCQQKQLPLIFDESRS